MVNKDFPEVEVILTEDNTEENMEILTAILRANLRRLYKYAKKGPGAGCCFVGSMLKCIDVLWKISCNRSTANFLHDMADKLEQLNAEFITPKTVFLGFSQIVNLAVGNLTTAFVSLLIAVRKKHGRM